MKVTLVNAQVLDGNNVVPPLGLLYVAGSLEAAGHEVQIFDADPEHETTMLQQIKDFNPGLIGISFLTVAYERAEGLCKALKKVLPDVMYCAGGVHATVKPEETLKAFDLDLIIMGEGEHTMVDLCNRLSKNESIEDAPGLLYQKDGAIVRTEPRELIQDLDSIPFPARHLIDMTPYLKPPGIIRGYADKNQTTIVTSRGCPFKCIYCGSHNIFGRKTRRRSYQNVVDEIEHLAKNFGIRGIYYCDDTFTLSSRWVKEYCNELKKRKLDIKWGCQSRVDQTDRALMIEMKSSGLVQLDFGVESGSEKILKVLGKGGAGDRTSQIKESFKLCKELDIRTLATFIIGNPTETKEDIDESFAVAKEIQADYTAFYFLTPYPGTDIYDQAIANGWLDPNLPFSEIWAHRQPELPLMAITFSQEDLRDIRRNLQNHFFRKNYLVRSGNISFYSILSTIFFRNPGIFLTAFGKFLRTRRMDYIVETLNAEYWRIKKYEGAG
ncbi:MAG: cobalamin-dependent protein [Nitrospira sp.]|nr:cobalamin B12-binding domain-containing protein [bacterium]MBL7048741.1 cobalamin-dependent protein [Nitrospira sp.]